jgi:hypothetical protein
VNIKPKATLTASQNLRNLVGALALAAEKNFEKVLEKILDNWKDMKDDFKKSDLQKRLQKLAFLMECGKRD